MTIHLTSSIARNIAEAAWGRGDTLAQRTNRRGTYFLTCQNGQGFILDDAALSADERSIFGGYTQPYEAKVISRIAGAPIYHHSLKQRMRGNGPRAVGEPAAFWIMGGDVLWTLPVLFAGIGLHGATPEEVLRLRMRAMQAFDGEYQVRHAA